ncbi:hypothetical protein [Candidatus Aalborgicola defluviihabitans]|uniref:hypothetical protein n=1 Tax=Candidatus Aalborgicola defluviihabitans TaxID=3386187 RepID=UPI0039B875C1
MHTCLRLLARGDSVIGLDNLNDYYDVSLKQSRLAQLQAHGNFNFTKIDVADRQGVAQLSISTSLSALSTGSAGRCALFHYQPHAYVDSNLVGVCQYSEGCRHNGVQHWSCQQSSVWAVTLHCL